MTVKELIKKLSGYSDEKVQILIPGDEPYDILDVEYDDDQEIPTVFIVLASL